MWSFRINSCIGLVVEFDPLANEPSEMLGSRDCLETAIEFDRCRKAAVSQHSPDRLIISWMVLEINRGRSVSKLMDCNSQADGFLNALDASESGYFRSSQPVRLARRPLSALAMRPMVIWLADLTRSVESDAQIGERK